jgi:hypothetical protein
VLNATYGTEFSVEAGRRHKFKKLNNLLDTCQDFDCIQASLSQSGAISTSKAQAYSGDGIYLMISKERLSDLIPSAGAEEIVFESMWEGDEVAIGVLVSP